MFASDSGNSIPNEISFIHDFSTFCPGFESSTSFYIEKITKRRFANEWLVKPDNELSQSPIVTVWLEFVEQCTQTTDNSDSTIRLLVYQLITPTLTPTCVIARATRACVYAIGGRLESPHGTVIWYSPFPTLRINEGETQEMIFSLANKYYLLFVRFPENWNSSNFKIMSTIIE